MTHRLAVVGADHQHVFQIVNDLALAGVEAAAHTTSGALIGEYAKWQPGSRESEFHEILFDDTIDIVVVAGVPSERASAAVIALRAGKWVVSDKPGATTIEQLDEIRSAASGHSGRRWTVVFSERLTSQSTKRAVELAQGGAIGNVVHIIGSGPHLLAARHRPAWFWDPVSSGGILADIGSHQVDQFLTIVGPAASELAAVTAAEVGNAANPDHPRMEDIGAMTIVARSATGAPARGDFRVDYLTAKGLGTWGDVRLKIIGTAGTIESRSNIDIGGAPGADHLFLVDQSAAVRVDVSDVRLDWAALLVADVDDNRERLMPIDHPFRVTELSIKAQMLAGIWGTGGTAISP